MLEKLYAARTGDPETAKMVSQMLNDYWKGSSPGNPKMIEPDQLEGFLGTEKYEELFPLVIAEPLINIHFAPEEVLYTLFRYEFHNTIEYFAQYLIEQRKGKKFTLDELDNLIRDKTWQQHPYKKTFLHHYIGVKTWFWELTIETEDDTDNKMKLCWIVSRVPQKPIDQDKIEYRLVEEEWLTKEDSLE